MITIIFFAQIRELLGTNKVMMSADKVNTVSDIANELAQRFPNWSLVPGDLSSDLLDGVPCLCAVNQTLVSFSTQVQSGDEVAFFPPVTGG